MRSHLTVRNVPEDLARALEVEARQRGLSLNRTVLALLRRALGQDPDQPYDNGLGSHAGGWSQDEVDAFERAVEPFEQIDPELWS
jgi:plasmid stability protein